MSELQARFEAYQTNVSSYIQIKESNKNTISLVFDPNEANPSMLSESILKLYLQKVYRLPQDKFRLLSSRNIVKEVMKPTSGATSKVKKAVEEVVMAKILIEIVDDGESLESKSAQLRADINDGSSLLFDLLPAYVSFNLGQSGLASHTKLAECRVLQKQGISIDGVQHIVTLLRHRTDPYIFLVVAINLTSGEEHVLELQWSDILVLIEGDMSLLESNKDSTEVQAIILNNLVLLHNDIEKQTSLACEQKVYFNTVMQDIFESQASAAAISTSR